MIGIVIEILVAVLLVLTIGYCVVLNRRLKRLKADEQTLKATISELLTASEIAERAILSLKATAHEADKTLSQRLDRAEAAAAELQRLTDTAERLARRPAPVQPPPVAAEPARPQPAAPRFGGFAARSAFSAARSG